MDKAHGVPNQLNIYELDVESDCTGYGRHNRLIVMMDRKTNTIDVREDNIGLPDSTDKDRRKLANNPAHRLHRKGSRLIFLDTMADKKSIWYRYSIV